MHELPAAPPAELEVWAIPNPDPQKRAESPFIGYPYPGKFILFDRHVELTARIALGSKVRGTAEEREGHIMLAPTQVSPPTTLSIPVERGRDNEPIGHLPDGRIVKFHTRSDVTGDIRPSDIAEGVVVREAPSFVIVWPRSLTQGSDRRVDLDLGRVYPFCPYVLNQLPPVSRGMADRRVFGVKAEQSQVSALFEDLVSAAFEFLGIGDVTRLGHHRQNEPVADGHIFCPDESHPDYVVIYDPKMRAGGTGFDLDTPQRRAFMDYVNQPRYEHVANRALVIVSSSFAHQPDTEAIPGATMTYLQSDALGLLCEYKALNPSRITSNSIRRLVFAGRVVDEPFMREWAGPGPSGLNLTTSLDW